MRDRTERLAAPPRTVAEPDARLPDFFVVGAPKSGTTALHQGLRSHPEIHLPAGKDVPSPYVGTDLVFRRWQLSPSEYECLLVPPRGETILGETCVWYLYSRRAAAEIASLRPDAHIVMVLRNPIEMIVGQHEQFLYNGNETLESLADALAAEPARRRGRDVPRSAHFPAGLAYVETARYARQVRRYLDRFPADQLSIFLFEDLVADAGAVVARILERVGARPVEIELPRANAGKQVRSPRLQRFLVTPPRWFEDAYHRVVPRRFHGRAAAWAVRRNVFERSRPSLDPGIRRELAARLEDDVHELGRMLGRNLDGWLAHS